MGNDVFSDYGDWLKEYGIKRADSYTSNLRTIDKQLISRGVSSYLQSVYDDVMTGKAVNILNVEKRLNSIMEAEQNAGLVNVSIAEGTFNDCKSALNKYKVFLIAKMRLTVNTPMQGTGIEDMGKIEWQTEDVRDVINMEDNDITYSFITKRDNAERTLNVKGRIISQDRLNKDIDKEVCFPVRTIKYIADNAADWADVLGLPESHPARRVKNAVDTWVEKLVDGIVFLLEKGMHIHLADVEQIGLEEIEQERHSVYVVTKCGDKHRVMSRRADGNIVPLILEKGESYSDITIDHVFRMEDILNDMAELLPFMKELTDLFRKLEQGDIRSAQTRNAVKKHIRKNFGKEYAQKMEQLIKEIELLGKIISLEIMYRKDNQAKH